MDNFPHIRQEIAASEGDVDPQRGVMCCDTWSSAPEAEGRVAVEPVDEALSADPELMDRDLTLDEVKWIIPQANDLSPSELEQERLKVKSWMVATRLQGEECEEFIADEKAHELQRRILEFGDDAVLGSETEDEIEREARRWRDSTTSSSENEA